MVASRRSSKGSRATATANAWCATESTHRYADLLREFDSARDRIATLRIERRSVVALRADYSLRLRCHAVCTTRRPDDSSDAAARSRLRTPCWPTATPRRCSTSIRRASGTGRLWRHRLSEHPLLVATRSGRRCRNRPVHVGLHRTTEGGPAKPASVPRQVRRPGKSLRTLAFLLFDHVAGLDTLFYTLSNGGTVVVTRDRSPSAVSRLIEDASVEVLSASPTFLRLLCLAGDDGERDLSSLKIITYGSEPMDPRTLALLNERFAGCRISQKYGTTETGSPLSASRANDSLWLKLGGDGVEVKVVDGVLHLRSESTILGYLNAPSPVDAEGWYCTGDLVEVDGDWIRFRGRSSDQINVGGEKVAPSEVEQVLLELDFVREAAVYGEAEPDRRAGRRGQDRAGRGHRRTGCHAAHPRSLPVTPCAAHDSGQDPLRGG